jgi:N-acetylmuramoyl-L-alanine amidase
MKICIDPGHGGEDPGAIGLYGTKEAIVNLQVGFRLKAMAQHLGYGAYLTREGDVFLPLGERGQKANEGHATCFISLHCNAHKNRDAWGMEIWTTKGRTRSDPLAQAIGTQLSRAFSKIEKFRADLSDGDIDKEANYTVLVTAKCPAVLIEMGFISHPNTEALLKTPAHQEAIAGAILRGVQAWEASCLGR